jgi:diaminopimelate epimerase
MEFTKLQSVGNDFVLVEDDHRSRDWPREAVAICNRHFGIGADGLLLLTKPSTNSLGMRVFNADGSEAEACGNGIRCLLKYAADRGLIADSATRVKVETTVGPRIAKLHRVKGRLAGIQVAMGRPKFGASEIPLAFEPDRDPVDINMIADFSITVDESDLKLAFVSMGNPHAVHFWNYQVDDFPLSRLGPDIERHQMFPNRINFEVARVISRREIEVRAWERGVGETLACGTGACAVAVAAQLLDYTDKNVDIRQPGGTLQVEWDGRGQVYLSGSAEVVFTGQWPEEHLR